MKAKSELTGDSKNTAEMTVSCVSRVTNWIAEQKSKQKEFTNDLCGYSILGVKYNESVLDDYMNNTIHWNEASNCLPCW